MWSFKRSTRQRKRVLRAFAAAVAGMPVNVWFVCYRTQGLLRHSTDGGFHHLARLDFAETRAAHATAVAGAGVPLVFSRLYGFPMRGGEVFAAPKPALLHVDWSVTELNDPRPITTEEAARIVREGTLATSDEELKSIVGEILDAVPAPTQGPGES